MRIRDNRQVRCRRLLGSEPAASLRGTRTPDAPPTRSPPPTFHGSRRGSADPARGVYDRHDDIERIGAKSDGSERADDPAEPAARHHRRRGPPDEVADQARGHPHAGEPELRPYVRHLPRRRRRVGRLGRRASASAHAPDGATDPGRPALLGVRHHRLQPRQDGRLQPGPDLRPVRLHATAPVRRAQLLGVGGALHARRPLLLGRARPVATRTTCTRSRASRRARTTTPRAGRCCGSLTWGCDSPPQEKVRVVDEEGHSKWVPSVLRHPDDRGPAAPARHAVVVLRGDVRPSRATSGRRSRRSSRCSTGRPGSVTCSRWIR